MLHILYIQRTRIMSNLKSQQQLHLNFSILQPVFWLQYKCPCALSHLLKHRAWGQIEQGFASYGAEWGRCPHHSFLAPALHRVKARTTRCGFEGTGYPNRRIYYQQTETLPKSPARWAFGYEPWKSIWRKRRTREMSVGFTHSPIQAYEQIVNKTPLSWQVPNLTRFVLTEFGQLHLLKTGLQLFSLLPTRFES